MATPEMKLRAGLLMAVVCHVERNIPQLFTEATTDRFELAAMELLGGGPLSFETIETLSRIRQSVQARSAARPWASALLAALDEAAT